MHSCCYDHTYGLDMMDRASGSARVARRWPAYCRPWVKIPKPCTGKMKSVTPPVVVVAHKRELTPCILPSHKTMCYGLDEFPWQQSRVSPGIVLSRASMWLRIKSSLSHSPLGGDMDKSLRPFGIRCSGLGRTDHGVKLRHYAEDMIRDLFFAGIASRVVHDVELDYPREFLVSVSGYVDYFYSVMVFYSLTLGSFFGRSAYHLDSIGVYFQPIVPPVVTVGPFGGQGRDSWDDGGHTAIVKLIIYSSEMIESIQMNKMIMGN
ncbi:hypothetical protein LguiA_029501 [Lonicera macranthoides]